VGRRLTGLDFKLSRSSMEAARAVRRCDEKRSDPDDLVSRSTTHCGDRTVRARWHPESYGIRDRCITSRNSLQKRKLCAVAPAPICEQQIGKMRA
jgi:hypothetical protein